MPAVLERFSMRVCMRTCVACEVMPCLAAHYSYRRCTHGRGVRGYVMPGSAIEFNAASELVLRGTDASALSIAEFCARHILVFTANVFSRAATSIFPIKALAGDDRVRSFNGSRRVALGCAHTHARTHACTCARTCGATGGVPLYRRRRACRRALRSDALLAPDTVYNDGTPARTHARTHARSHARSHARTQESALAPDTGEAEVTGKGPREARIHTHIHTRIHAPAHPRVCACARAQAHADSTEQSWPNAATNACALSDSDSGLDSTFDSTSGRHIGNYS